MSTSAPLYTAKSLKLYSGSGVQLSLGIDANGLGSLGLVNTVTGAPLAINMPALTVGADAVSAVSVMQTLTAHADTSAVSDARAVSAEAILQAKIDDEVLARTNAVILLTADVITNKTSEEADIAGLNAFFTGVCAEETRRAGVAEVVLTESLATEVARAMAREVVLTASIETETSRATLAESSLRSQTAWNTSQIVVNKSIATSAIDAEVVRAKLAELEATASINANYSRQTDEIAERTILGSSLQAQLTDLVLALTAERTRANNYEAVLASRIQNLISNADPAALDSLSEITRQFTSIDTSMLLRMNIIETYLKNTFALESLGELTISDMMQVLLDIANSASVIPNGATPVATVDGSWGFTNTLVSPSIQWFLFTQNAEQHATLGNLSGIYAYFKINTYVSGQSLPNICVYTKLNTDASLNAGSFYQSRRVYTFPTSFIPIEGSVCLMYFGAELPGVFPNAPQIALLENPMFSNGTSASTQEILSASLQTDPTAPVGCVDIAFSNFMYGINGRHTNVSLTAPH